MFIQGYYTPDIVRKGLFYMIGIYKITNTLNNMCYIGQSKNISKRWNNHKSVYDNENSHGYNYYLYRAMRKYGIENFTFEIIEECDIDSLNEREIYWINYYDSYNNGMWPNLVRHTVWVREIERSNRFIPIISDNADYNNTNYRRVPHSPFFCK